MKDIEKRLAAQLYRATCPTADKLGEYHLHILSGSRGDTIRKHLEGCPLCRAELAQLQVYLTDLTPDIEYNLNERIKIWIARLIPDGMNGGGLQPALALRGQNNSLLMYEAGDAQLSLEIQDDPKNAGARTILGLLIGAETMAATAHLWQEAQKITQVPIDELGNFVFAGLAPGTYELIISGSDFEIHIQKLDAS